MRVRPTSDYEVRVERVTDIIAEPLQVIDLGLGGLGLLAADELAGVMVGDRLELRLTFPGSAPVDAHAVVRHIALRLGVCGVEFESPSADLTTSVRRAVSDLLERGSLA